MLQDDIDGIGNISDTKTNKAHLAMFSFKRETAFF